MHNKMNLAKDAFAPDLKYNIQTTMPLANDEFAPGLKYNIQTTMQLANYELAPGFQPGDRPHHPLPADFSPPTRKVRTKVQTTRWHILPALKHRANSSFY
jgi:hypothetical protein